MDRARAQPALRGGIIESIRHLPLAAARLTRVRDAIVATKAPGSGLHEKPTTIDEDLSRRIELSRVILIAAIVLHHVRIPAELSLFTWDNLGYVRGYVQLGLAKTATSTLTIISGYLLFSSRFECKPAEFMRKKCRTLLMPLLIWNIPLALVLFILQKNGQYLLKYDDLANGGILNWANALLGLTHEPVNGPLHFLRNIIGCNIIALLLAATFRRHTATVFAVILAIGLLNLDGALVARSDMLIGFFLGGFVAVRGIDCKLIDFLLPVTGPCFLVSAFLMFYWQISYDSLWWIPHRLVGFLCAWPIIGYFNRRKLGHVLRKYSKYMFFIFLSHYYVMLLSFVIFSHFFSLEYFYVYFLVAAPVAIGVSISGQIMAARFMSPLLRIATGGRS